MNLIRALQPLCQSAAGSFIQCANPGSRALEGGESSLHCLPLVQIVTHSAL